ncbi:hypothetical protein V1502_08450 [Bacillus sp. SCS-153A]|uniref:hypothetical protein n=1 Tax=Rossellomorea sedimentorum TaxID=3115294 RepID=UPI0039059F46
MKNLPAKILIGLIVVSGIGYYIGNYTMIHKEKIKSAVISHKEESDSKFYITVEGKKLLMKDENLWNVVDEHTPYDIEYEWYGEKVPYVTHIFVHGEGHSSEGAH